MAIVAAAVVTTALIALLFVLSSGIEVQYEYSFHVTSNTTLWDPGTHHFSVTGEAHILSPVDETFPVEGEGTATYAMVGVAFPPGEFDLQINFSTYLNTSFYGGPLNLSGVGHGVTSVVWPPNPGFVRTEELRDFSIVGRYNGLWWNATTELATIDFSMIDPDGKEFQIRIRGTSRLAFQPPPAPVAEPMVTLTISVALLVGVARRHC